MKSPFKITPRVIAHLGEDLIKNESIALLELVKNSYDAYAKQCSIHFSFNDNTQLLHSLYIKDDGVGMSLELIKNVWLVIGTDYKKRVIDSGRYDGRMPMGEKGIGRLGIHKLGNKILMYTKTEEGHEVRLHIDWEKLNNSREVDDFVIDIEEYENPVHFTTNGHGTLIEINSLKGEWDRRMLRAVYRDLMSLNSPFSHKNDSFNVSVTSNSDVFKGLPNIHDILSCGMYRAHCTIEGNKIIDFLYQFTPWENLTKIHGRTVCQLDNDDQYLRRKIDDYSGTGRRKIKEFPLNLSIYKIGRLEIDLVIFERDVSVFSYVNMERKSLNDYLRENGGIRVYRDDVRVYNYGEKGNDWLGLDSKRLGRAGGSIGNNLVIGAVSIDRRASLDLKEKTNREGFIENEAYFAFVDAIKYAIDRILQYRNVDKFNLTSIYKETSRTTEPVVGDLNEVIKIVERVVIDEKEKTKIKNYLFRIEQQYKDVRDTLIKSANAGLNLGVAVHEMEKQIAQLKGLAARGEIENIKQLADRLEKTVAGYSVFLSNSDRRLMNVEDIAKIVIENNLFRFKAHNIKIFSNYKTFTGKAMLSKAESIASLTNLIDNAIYWVSRSRETNRMIYVYLTTEIKDYITIAVCDNGPGFKLPMEMAIQPFVTGKPMNTGMGLGLHITNEVMLAMKGKLLILDSYDLQLPTKIKDYTNNPTVVALCFPLG